jgi:hypothetical protein
VAEIIRPYTDSDLEPTLETLRAAMGEAPALVFDEALIRWKHLDNPFGRSIMLVADVDGVIAGFRSFMRWDLVTPTGEMLRCVRAVDTATHPSFLRRGMPVSTWCSTRPIPSPVPVTCPWGGMRSDTSG